jgi:hypothetical protein
MRFGVGDIEPDTRVGGGHGSRRPGLVRRRHSPVGERRYWSARRRPRDSLLRNNIKDMARFTGNHACSIRAYSSAWSRRPGTEANIPAGDLRSPDAISPPPGEHVQLSATSATSFQTLSMVREWLRPFPARCQGEGREQGLPFQAATRGAEPSTLPTSWIPIAPRSAVRPGSCRT